MLHFFLNLNFAFETIAQQLSKFLKKSMWLSLLQCTVLAIAIELRAAIGLRVANYFNQSGFIKIPVLLNVQIRYKKSSKIKGIICENGTAI